MDQEAAFFGHKALILTMELTLLLEEAFLTCKTFFPHFQVEETIRMTSIQTSQIQEVESLSEGVEVQWDKDLSDRSTPSEEEVALEEVPVSVAAEASSRD